MSVIRKTRFQLRDLLFWTGALSVTTGVIFHLPMFIDCASMNYEMVGMKMTPLMLVGMVLILTGFILAGLGLLPQGRAERPLVSPAIMPHEAQLRPAHIQVLAVLTIALVIDMLKPATLGFVVPGAAKEYGLSRHAIALLPFFALLGTATGSFLWGGVADFIGRRAAIMWAAVMFIGTSICGAMPSFEWNLVMCFVMGLAVGGMLPIAYTLLTEIMPAHCRGVCLVLVGGFGLSGGYLLAATAAALLEPHFGWRIMWFLGLPTGILLIALNYYIPESMHFLILHGRETEALGLSSRFFGNSVDVGQPTNKSASVAKARSAPFRNRTAILCAASMAWGMVNFGLLLWLPADLRSDGFTITSSNSLLAHSALFAFPTALLAAWFYNAWSTKWTLVGASCLTALGLLGCYAVTGPYEGAKNMLPTMVTVLMIGNSGVFAVILPYSAETYATRIRGRATGMIAGLGKLGGVVVQILTMLALIPTLGMLTLDLALVTLFTGLMIGKNGVETQQRKLDDIDSGFQTSAAGLSDL